MPAPRLVILGQITLDDVVPARPGPWARQLGGNALYAAAGARMLLRPGDVGVVSRIGSGMPFDIKALLGRFGVAAALRRIDQEHLIEWLIYEEDGSRRCLPRNPSLRQRVGEGLRADEDYLRYLEAQSPEATDLPEEWRQAKGFHLAPQVFERHRASLDALAGGAFVTLDPSPHYSRYLKPRAYAQSLAGASAILPSEQEIRHLMPEGSTDPKALADIAAGLMNAGIPEVVIKAGARGCVVAVDGGVGWVDAMPVPSVVDPTGAGDAFCGAYAAARVLGLTPFDAAGKAVAAGAAVIACSGAEAAFDPTERR